MLKGSGVPGLSDVDLSKELMHVNEKPSDLPLAEPSCASADGSEVSKRIAQLSAKAQALSGVALPKYYNPAAVNPLKYAEQMQKRKLLWQGSKEKKVSSSWQETLAAAGDDKSAEKFKKLVGVRAGEELELATASETQKQRQDEVFRTLDAQYEIARLSTHTMRGVGLGFGVAPIAPVVAAPPTTIAKPSQ